MTWEELKTLADQNGLMLDTVIQEDGSCFRARVYQKLNNAFELLTEFDSITPQSLEVFLNENKKPS